MNKVIGPVYIADAEEVGSYGKPFSKALEGIIDKEARQIVTDAYVKTEELLRKHQGKLEKVLCTKADSSMS